VQQAPDAGLAARRDNLSDQLDMRRLETVCAAAIVQHAHQVDDSVRSLHEFRKLGRLMHVSHDNVRGREKDQLFLGALAVARCDPDTIAFGRKPMTEMLSDKTASPQNADRSNFHVKSPHLMRDQERTAVSVQAKISNANVKRAS
jgi:hypothetical protein